MIVLFLINTTKSQWERLMQITVDIQSDNQYSSHRCRRATRWSFRWSSSPAAFLKHGRVATCPVFPRIVLFFHQLSWENINLCMKHTRHMRLLQSLFPVINWRYQEVVGFQNKARREKTNKQTKNIVSISGPRFIYCWTEYFLDCLHGWHEILLLCTLSNTLISPPRGHHLHLI